jgi:osmoprotectant transport system ATP-binding protein
MIRLENISKSFDSVRALYDIRLTISDGKTTVLIGPSGCGKSTMLRLIIGLIHSDSGKIFIGDTPLDLLDILQVRKNTGYVIQEGGLFPHLTARRNIILMAHQSGWQKSEVERRLNELAKLTKFPRQALERYPLNLSGGQQQRVSLMRALMLDPDVLLMDEPLGALDPMIRYDLQTDLKSIFRKLGKTVLLVTHDLAEAVYFADHIVLMNEGQIIQEGLLNDFLQKPANPFVSRFILAQRPLLENERKQRE